MRPKPDRAPFDLLIEDAGTEGCLGHVPTLPGLCFRARDAEEAEAIASDRIAEYAAWLRAEDMTDLSSETEEAVRCANAEGSSGLWTVAAEHVAGAPVWESGNAAVLFRSDLCPLDDRAVAARLRFVRRVLDRIREVVVRLSASDRASRPASNRRSVDETLEHVGNCVWWYCSRIDDDLPEPEEIPNEDPLDRIDRLFAIAEAFLLAVPYSARTSIHVPMRFPTADPNERWTHTKVCRRQAEHVWAHLPGLRASASLRTPSSES
jgi:hypothetical protein